MKKQRVSGSFLTGLVFCLFSMVPFPAQCGQVTGLTGGPDIAHSMDVQDYPLHEAWEVMLGMFVTSDGWVDYDGFMSALPQFEALLSRMSTEVPSDEGSDAALAFWINAYNAFTIKMVVDHYPISSIKDLHDGNPWDVVWIHIGGNSYSLNMIENEVIRERFGDPRVHFALNCAARSCPPLYDRSFKPDVVSRQLEYLAHRFINDPDENTITESSLKLSKIFEWYKEDFGDLRDFIHRYSMVRLQQNVRISFLPYDWSLNDLALREE